MAGAQIRVASGNFIAAKPIGVLEGVDFQFTGTVRKVDGIAIARRLETGEVVLVPHVGYSPTGEVFNLAWEDVAENVARTLKADKLLLYVDQLPVGRRGQIISELTALESEALLRKEGLTAPVKRAIEHALRAVRAGVGRAHLISRRAEGATLLELFTHQGVGTMITADPVERLRPAKIDDVGGILALIEPLEADGTLVKRNRERLEQEIANFEVIEHDGSILACAALYPYPDDKSAELACLAVSPEYRDAGYGERLLVACEARAKVLKIRRVFALTTRAQHWFLAQGFKEAGVAVLPEKRQALYNWKRGSKIFLTRLYLMARMVKCVKVGREAEGLDRPTYPGELGKRIYDNVSKEAWAQWIKHQTMLVNENRLNLADAKARKYLVEQMEKHFFGDGADVAQGYVPPKN